MDETEAQFDARLCRVIAHANTAYLDQDYRWVPLGDHEPPNPGSIACVRDAASWHQFVPARETDTRNGRFKVVCFRFAEDGPSAIGFVAWLHSNLRTMGNTAALVICGKDVRDSEKLFEVCYGVMDYWACPVGPSGDRFLKVIQTLIARGQSL